MALTRAGVNLRHSASLGAASLKGVRAPHPEAARRAVSFRLFGGGLIEGTSSAGASRARRWSFRLFGGGLIEGGRGADILYRLSDCHSASLGAASLKDGRGELGLLRLLVIPPLWGRPH